MASKPLVKPFASLTACRVYQPCVPLLPVVVLSMHGTGETPVASAPDSQAFHVPSPRSPLRTRGPLSLSVHPLRVSVHMHVLIFVFISHNLRVLFAACSQLNTPQDNSITRAIRVKKLYAASSKTSPLPAAHLRPSSCLSIQAATCFRRLADPLLTVTHLWPFPCVCPSIQGAEC